MTKKQKRAMGIAQRQAFMEEVKRIGLENQRWSQRQELSRMKDAWLHGAEINGERMAFLMKCLGIKHIMEIV